MGKNREEHLRRLSDVLSAFDGLSSGNLTAYTFRLLTISENLLSLLGQIICAGVVGGQKKALPPHR